jgi:phosphohistidine swiveling domain-containing protein
MKSVTEGQIDEVVEWDPLHARSPRGRHWSTANIGEALPGVLTPLTWSLWEVAAEGATRQAFYALGAATAAERVVPADREQRFIRAFYGRGAAQLEFLCQMGDRIPGTSGAAIAMQVFGSAPPALVGRARRDRYPVIAARFPLTAVRIRRVLRAAAADTALWWQREIAAMPGRDVAATRAAFAEARERFRRNVAIQATTLFCAVQPCYDILARLIDETGIGERSMLGGGYGAVPEAAMVSDLWRVSRGQLDLDEIVSRHGFHGPRAGEMSAQVWREDSGPLRRLVGEYAELGEERSPMRRELELAEQRQSLEQQIVTALPSTRRLLARQAIRLVSTTIPLRGIAKDAYLQSSDVIRAASRRLGELLVETGTLASPDDVFFLTDREVLSGDLSEARDLAERRRARHRHYQELVLPAQWCGDPVPLTPHRQPSNGATVLQGIGVSPGTAEGRARVVSDPSEEIEPGEILVAPTTDPSWSSIMFLAAALVVDIGGALSHAAIVARELGVPCVVNTVSGTRSIRTGDRCRVDGQAGTVQILCRTTSGIASVGLSANSRNPRRMTYE